MAHNELVRALCVRLTEVIQLPRYSGHRDVVLLACAVALNCSGGAGLPAEYTQAADLALADAEHTLPPGEPLCIITLTNEVQSIVLDHLSDIADAETRERLDHSARFEVLCAVGVMARYCRHINVV